MECLFHFLVSFLMVQMLGRVCLQNEKRTGVLIMLTLSVGAVKEIRDLIVHPEWQKEAPHLMTIFGETLLDMTCNSLGIAVGIWAWNRWAKIC